MNQMQPQQPQPANIPDASRIIVIGDVHGDIERLIKLLVTIGIFSTNLEWIAQPRDTVVIQLGDQIDSLSRRLDRGGDLQWETSPDLEVLVLMDKLDEIAKNSSDGRGRVLSLIGNHEIMNVLGIFAYVSENSMNKTGGAEIRHSLLRPGTQIGTILAKRNVVCKIGPFLFCHGGILPQHLEVVYNNFDTINMCMRKYLLGKEQLSPEELFVMNQVICEENNGIIWTRKYIELATYQPEVLEMLMDVICEKTNTMVVFVGHNTVDTIKRVADGKLYFTDTGFSRSYPLHENYVEVIEIMKKESSYNVETLRVFIS